MQFVGGRAVGSFVSEYFVFIRYGQCFGVFIDVVQYSTVCPG